MIVVECDRKREAKDGSKDFDLSTWEDGVTVYRDRKDHGREGVGKGMGKEIEIEVETERKRGRGRRRRRERGKGRRRGRGKDRLPCKNWLTWLWKMRRPKVYRPSW
jgi:hypothetical protein